MLIYDTTALYSAKARPQGLRSLRGRSLLRIRIVTKEPAAEEAKVSKNVASVRGMGLLQIK